LEALAAVFPCLLRARVVAFTFLCGNFYGLCPIETNPSWRQIVYKAGSGLYRVTGLPCRWRAIHRGL